MRAQLDRRSFESGLGCSLSDSEICLSRSLITRPDKSFDSFRFVSVTLSSMLILVWRASNSSNNFSHRNCGRESAKQMFRNDRGSFAPLWPMVILSHVPPSDWILEAWLTARQVDASRVVKAVRRESGRPHTKRLPLTTRWVWRWTRWSAGLPLKTFRPAML